MRDMHRIFAVVLLSATMVAAHGGTAHAGLVETIKQQGTAVRESAQYAPQESVGGVQTTVAKIVNGSLALLGAIFFGLMVYAGYLWMTSRDESEQVDKAKETMRRAVIGLIIVLAAYAISKFITVAIQKGTGNV